ncbi:MAG: glycosyltransferase family 39 protein [Chloroflexi bacterium]|nr:glycosyltransferase family 39 protein [Chloroflexota bacterium]MCL5276106.1 glycosyltransferase family 39 protein [Chloroflexota bacterium]
MPHPVTGAKSGSKAAGTFPAANFGACAALALAVTIFLAISLHQLTLPGFYYDEALDLAPMLQLIHGEPVNLLRGIGISIGQTSFPVMLLDYMGSLNGYLNIPFMLLLGPGVVAARLEPILFSALTIVLAYALARAWFGRGAAILTALLLAINPSFIWFSRQGISVTSVMTVFSLGSLLLIERWRGKRLEIRDWRLEVRGQRSEVRSKRQETRGKNPETRSQKSEGRGKRLEIGDWRLVSGGISNLHSAISILQSPISNLQSRFSNLQSPRFASNLSLLLAGVLIGLGLWAKLLFLWWIVVLGVLALVWLAFGRSARTADRLRVMVRALPWLLGGCAIGAAPLIYYNLADLLRQPFDLSNAYTLGLVFKSLGRTTDYGVNNLNLLANLNKAIADFNVFIDGSYFWYNGVPFSNVYAVPAFVISAVAGSILALRRSEWRKWLALLAAIAATVFISAFTVSGLWATHLFIIVPLPQMVVAVAAVWLARWLGGLAARIGQSMRRPSHPESLIPNLQSLISILSVVVVLALPVSRDLWVSWQQHAKLAQTGGSGRFSDAIYKLAAYLDTQHIAQPIALDWGIEKNVRVLTDDRVRPEEIFGFTPEPGALFEQRARELLRDPSRQYIVLWDRFAVYNRRKAFTQIAGEMGLQVTETFIAHERSGLPVYVVLQAR